MHKVNALLIVAISLPLLAGEASGEFVTTKHAKIQPKYAAAFETRDQRDARKRVIEVILSEAPVDVSAAVAELDPDTNIINQPALKNQNYIRLWVRPNNDVSMNATYSETMTQFVDFTPGSLEAKIDIYTPERVAGRLRTTRAVPLMHDETYSIDVKFDTAVTRAPAGTKLPAGGGEPGKALTALFGAIAKKNFNAIKSGVTPKNAESFEDLNDAIQTLGIWLPKSHAKIDGGELHGDSAVLDVEAEVFAGQQGIFLVRMVKSGERWQFDSATRAGMID